MSVLKSIEDVHDNKHHYAVLNLPSTASDYEIRERYRQLSIHFHPDKQQDPAAKDAVFPEFLKIQKAYEVLSDPFLRYDCISYKVVIKTLEVNAPLSSLKDGRERGEEGLQMKFPDDFNEKSMDEIKSELKIVKREIETRKIEDLVRSNGRLKIGVDARSLFQSYPLGAPRRLRGIRNRIRNVDIHSIGLRHSLQQWIDDKTRIQLSSIVSLKSTAQRLTGQGRANVIGTVRHQYSPRLYFECALPLLSNPSLTLKTNYDNSDSSVLVQTQMSPAILRFERLSPPPSTVTYVRRLFSDSETRGIISFSTMSPVPTLSIDVMVPDAFDFTPTINSTIDPLSEEESPEFGVEQGLMKGTKHYNVGITFGGIASAIRGEWSFGLSQLALHMRFGVALGFFGLDYWMSGSWDSSAYRAGLDATITAGVQGVSLSLNLRYIGQHFTIPIMLSSEKDGKMVIYTSIIPAVVGILGYHLIYQPQQEKKRLKYIRKLRSELRSSMQSHEADEVRQRIIKETARRHVQAEKAVDGLLIERATYGCCLPNDEARELIVDVTAPLQCLVHKGQLFISGDHNKSDLQGFIDPAPRMPKILLVDYTFRGRAHHAQVRDSLPVVLPLEGKRKLMLAPHELANSKQSIL